MIIVSLFEQGAHSLGPPPGFSSLRRLSASSTRRHMDENRPDCCNDWISKARMHARRFCEHRETPAWNLGSKGARVPDSASHLSALSQSSRAGMTQKGDPHPELPQAA